MLSCSRLARIGERAAELGSQEQYQSMWQPLVTDFPVVVVVVDALSLVREMKSARKRPPSKRDRVAFLANNNNKQVSAIC